MKKFNYMIIAFIGLFILTACTSTQAEQAVVAVNGAAGQPADVMSNPDDEAMMEEKEDNMTDAAMGDGDEMMSSDNHDNIAGSDGTIASQEDEAMTVDTELSAWQQIPLTDARTGEAFTLADFAGKAVFVEPMATWCTNCRRQLGNVRDARAQIGDDNVVFIGLSLETNISDDELAQYQSDYGYDWTFAVMTPELLQELATAFGRSITSAPSTPHFVIRPDGSFTDLVTGIESVDQILQQLEAVRG